MDAAEPSPARDAASAAAVALVEPGTTIGLGSGRAVWRTIDRIAERWPEGPPLRAVVASELTRARAEAAGIDVVELDGTFDLDLALDGADEVDPALRLIKGGGGALLREKMVAQASKREVIIADEAKLSPKLGTKHALPVEVVRFGWEAQMRWLEGLGARVTRRSGPDGAPFVTDEGHWLLDCAFGPLDDPAALARTLEGRAGVVEHGLFLGVATEVVVAGEAGVRVLTPS